MKIKKFENLNENQVTPTYVYIIINQNMHSYEAILGIYDSFDKAMSSSAWSEYEETPDSSGFGDTLFIYREELNKDLTYPHNSR